MCHTLSSVGELAEAPQQAGGWPSLRTTKRWGASPEHVRTYPYEVSRGKCGTLSSEPLLRTGLRRVGDEAAQDGLERCLRPQSCIITFLKWLLQEGTCFPATCLTCNSSSTMPTRSIHRTFWKPHSRALLGFLKWLHHKLWNMIDWDLTAEPKASLKIWQK